MPNKVKDIFSDDMFNINSTLQFRDNEAHKNFLAALEIAYAEGRIVPVDGITSISTKISHQEMEFLLEQHTDISHFVVGPSVEPVTVPLIVGTDEKPITLWRSQTKDTVVLRSNPNSIISFQFTFFLREKRNTLNYKVQFEKAKSIKEVADNFGLAAALLTYFYKNEDEKPAEENKVSLSDIKNYFHYYEAFFKRLCAIENELGISISPSLLNNLPREEQQDIDELYLLLCEKQVVRLSAKLTYTDSTSITMNHSNNELNVGDKIALTFLGTIEFNFLKQTILMHTANLIVNTLIKDIQKSSDGKVKILYGDTDSKPMYISFSAFKTEEAAKQEMNSIMEHDYIYINALPSNAYIKQFYSK